MIPGRVLAVDKFGNDETDKLAESHKVPAHVLTAKQRILTQVKATHRMMVQIITERQTHELAPCVILPPTLRVYLPRYFQTCLWQAHDLRSHVNLVHGLFTFTMMVFPSPRAASFSWTERHKSKL